MHYTLTFQGVKRCFFVVVRQQFGIRKFDSAEFHSIFRLCHMVELGVFEEQYF